jgi:hypothetical protein
LPWLALAGVLAAPGSASAGRTQYGWLFGTEVMPERGAELQTWIDEENGRDPGDIHWTTWGFTALVGVTDQLELSLPLEFLWRDSDATEPSFTFSQYGIEARYRFVSSDPVDAPPFAPLARLAVKRDVTVRDVVVVEADLVASTTTTSGSVHALIDLGVTAVLGADDQVFALRPGAGVSVKATGDLRFGAEVFSELDLESKATSWAAAGPNVAWSHGRFWMSAAFGIGIYHIKTAPRVQWGIAF